MPKLCCLLNENTRGPVKCRECEFIWDCWCEWQHDLTHRTARYFTKCPTTGKDMGWDRATLSGDKDFQYIHDMNKNDPKAL